MANKFVEKRFRLQTRLQVEKKITLRPDQLSNKSLCFTVEKSFRQRTRLQVENKCTLLTGQSSNKRLRFTI